VALPFCTYPFWNEACTDVLVLREKGYPMKKLIPMLLVMAVTGSAVAFPGGNTDKPQGPLSLYIDAAGIGTIMNDGIEPFQFDGYTIAGNNGYTFNEAVGEARPFKSIGTRALTDGGILAAKLGFGVYTFGALTSQDDLVSDGSLSGVAILQPGDSFDLGDLVFTGAPTQADLTFTYIDSASGGSWEGGWPSPPPCDPDLTVDLPDSEVWDVTVDDSFQISASIVGEPGDYFASEWTWDGFPALTATGSSAGWSWAEVQAAGVTLGSYTLRCDVVTECTTACDTMTLDIVPEPATLSLLGLGALALIRRRR